MIWMAHDIQITNVTSLRGRCYFDEFLKGIMLSIFFENERICLHICNFVEQNICSYFRKFLFILALGMGVTDI